MFLIRKKLRADVGLFLSTSEHSAEIQCGLTAIGTHKGFSEYLTTMNECYSIPTQDCITYINSPQYCQAIIT